MIFRCIGSRPAGRFAGNEPIHVMQIVKQVRRAAMSTEPVRVRRESVLAAIAFAPSRAIERTRGWSRLGLLVLYGLMALVIWGLLWRRSQLAALPDVGEPFDVAAFRLPAHVPDDRNAFVPYRRAAHGFGT